MGCRWHYDKDVPGGKFLVPGCWNRAVYGDEAECHCGTSKETIGEVLAGLRDDVAKLKRQIRDITKGTAKE